MKKFLSILLALFLLQNLSAQNIFRVVVKSDDEELELLAGATARIAGTQIVAVADSNGVIVLQNIPDGEQTIEFSSVGYFKRKVKVTFPQAAYNPAS